MGCALSVPTLTRGGHIKLNSRVRLLISKRALDCVHRTLPRPGPPRRSRRAIIFGASTSTYGHPVHCMRELISSSITAVTYISLLAFVVAGVARAGIEAKKRRSQNLARFQDEF